MSQIVRALDPIEVGAEDTYSNANGDPLALDFTSAVDSFTVSSASVVSVTPTGLTIANPTPNASSYQNNAGVTVAAGKAVLIDKSGGTAGKSYVLRIQVTLSNGSVRVGEVSIYVG